MYDWKRRQVIKSQDDNVSPRYLLSPAICVVCLRALLSSRLSFYVVSHLQLPFSFFSFYFSSSSATTRRSFSRISTRLCLCFAASPVPRCRLSIVGRAAHEGEGVTRGQSREQIYSRRHVRGASLSMTKKTPVFFFPPPVTLLSFSQSSPSSRSKTNRSDYRASATQLTPPEPPVLSPVSCFFFPCTSPSTTPPCACIFAHGPIAFCEGGFGDGGEGMWRLVEIKDK